MQSKDYAGWRFSGLDQITTENVHSLRMAWSFSDGTLFGHEGAPLVVGETMYLVSPFPNIAYALDLSKPGAPIRWAYSPEPLPVAIGKACCDAVIRGWAFAEGRLVFNLLDAHTVAVDAKTGKELWRTRLARAEDGVTMTMSPLIARGKVFVGNSGGEMGAHGWLAALELTSGKELWRAFSTGPDSLVRIGPDFHPYYGWMRGKDLGATSWPSGAWRQGGGAVWGFLTYDPELNLIYHGTSNPGPRVPAQRPGLNLWTSAVFARDPDSGMARWAYQFTPHDQWDYDGVNENILVDLPIAGRTRKALVHFNRNGFAYTLDRATGEVLVAKPFVHLNWSSGVDLTTGMPRVVPAKQPRPGATVRDICPPDIGGKDWQPAAFSPRTGLFYVPTQNICMDLTDHLVGYIAGTPYDGMEMTRRAGPGGNWGELIAWDASVGRKVWGIKERFVTYSGVLTTAGDVVFYGTADGWFRAVDARSGRVLWSQKLGSGIVAQPMTYRGPDGRQYVAVYSGIGGAAIVTSFVPGFPARGSTLFVFSLNGDSPHGGARMLETDALAPAVQHDLHRADRR
jgi:alcohol dehydrogenase (cytochrome c)